MKLNSNIAAILEVVRKRFGILLALNSIGVIGLVVAWLLFRWIVPGVVAVCRS